MKKSKYVYGQSPNPTSWGQLAEILKQNSPKKGAPRGDASKPTSK